MAQVSFRSVAPVLSVRDVARSLEWYRTYFAFRANPFPQNPPHAFAVLWRDGVEIMLQRVDGVVKVPEYTARDGGVWDAYVRLDGVAALYAVVARQKAVEVLEPLRKQPYGDSEFVVRDPDGNVLVFSEMAKSA